MKALWQTIFGSENYHFVGSEMALLLHKNHCEPMDPAVEPQEAYGAGSPLLLFVAPVGCWPLPVPQPGSFLF